VASVAQLPFADERDEEASTWEMLDVEPAAQPELRPVAPGGPGGGGDGHSAPKVDKPNVDELLKRMRKVDPDQARRYRQRTGQ